jgi:hypothetical protein
MGNTMPLGAKMAERWAETVSRRMEGRPLHTSVVGMEVLGYVSIRYDRVPYPYAQLGVDITATFNAVHPCISAVRKRSIEVRSIVP